MPLFSGMLAVSWKPWRFPEQASGVVTASPGQMEWELLSETGCLLGAWSPVAPPPPTHPQALFWLLPLSDLSFFSINT